MRISINVPSAFVARVDALGARAEVLRLALERGLAELEAFQAPADLPTALLAKVQELGPRFRRLVPIPELRRAFPAVSCAIFDRTLLELEGERRTNLKIANDPTAVETAGGIRVEGRGLVFYAVAD